jgi:hypothetical protein
MRRTALVLGVVALLTAGGAGVASAASTSPAGDPGVAHGYYLALNGTSDDGTWAPQSDTLVDPKVGQCYDVTSVTTGPAAWTESVNRTDKVALLSPKTCAQKAADQQAAEQAGTTGRAAAEEQHAARWTTPDTVSSATEGFSFRSVSFSNIP